MFEYKYLFEISIVEVDQEVGQKWLNEALKHTCLISDGKCKSIDCQLCVLKQGLQQIPKKQANDNRTHYFQK